MEEKKRPWLRTLVNSCHHGDSKSHWGYCRTRVRKSLPIEDWELVPKTPWLPGRFPQNKSKYLSNLNIGRRLLKLRNNERNHTHEVKNKLKIKHLDFCTLEIFKEFLSEWKLRKQKLVLKIPQKAFQVKIVSFTQASTLLLLTTPLKHSEVIVIKEREAIEARF